MTELPISHQLPAVLAVLLVGLVISSYALRLYGTRSEDGLSERSKLPGWMERWDFSPQQLGGFSYWRLFMLSVIGLFLELLMIRWISSELSVFAYFKNFVPVACYLGFGTGCYLANRRMNLLAMLVSLVALSVICDLPSQTLRAAFYQLPYMIGAISQVNLWGMPSFPVNAQSLSLTLWALLCVIPVFELIALLFIPIGQLVGWYLENATQGIPGYTVNILGSLLGIALYTTLCFLWQPPAIWFVAAGAMLLCFLWRTPLFRWSVTAAFSLSIILAAVAGNGGGKIYWSPYQKLTVRPISVAGETISYEIATNDSWYQQIVNLSPGFVAAHPQWFKQEQRHGAPITCRITSTRILRRYWY